MQRQDGEETTEHVAKVYLSRIYVHVLGHDLKQIRLLTLQINTCTRKRTCCMWEAGHFHLIFRHVCILVRYRRLYAAVLSFSCRWWYCVARCHCRVIQFFPSPVYNNARKTMLQTHASRLETNPHSCAHSGKTRRTFFSWRPTKPSA